MLVTFSEEFIDWILRAATTSPHNEVNLQNNTTQAERVKREGYTQLWYGMVFLLELRHL